MPGVMAGVGRDRLKHPPRLERRGLYPRKAPGRSQEKQKVRPKAG